MRDTSESKINLLYDIGDLVYLKTDPNQYDRIITEVIIFPGGIKYGLCCGTSLSFHYDFEITLGKNVVKAMNNN